MSGADFSRVAALGPARRGALTATCRCGLLGADRLESEDLPMLFALLEFGDYFMLAVLIMIFASGGAATATAYRRSSGRQVIDRKRLQRIEDKLDLVLSHLGIKYVPAPKDEWQELADSPDHKIE